MISAEEALEIEFGDPFFQRKSISNTKFSSHHFFMKNFSATHFDDAPKATQTHRRPTLLQCPLG